MVNDEYEKYLKQVFDATKQYGLKYYEKFILKPGVFVDGDGKVKAGLENNEFIDSIEFIFGHAFMRGRKDLLSSRYCEYTLKVIKENKTIFAQEDKKKTISLKNQIKKIKKNLRHDNKKVNILNLKNRENSEIKKLLAISTISYLTDDTYTWYKNENDGRYSVLGNDNDLIMVLDVLEKRETINYKNLKEMIEKGNITKAYEDLKKIDQVGPKLASFILRDIIIMNKGKLNADSNKEEGLKCIFPIDTWVKHIYSKLQEYPDEKVKNEDVQKWYINTLSKFKLNDYYTTSLIAAGIWYMGYHSLDLLLENIKDKKS